MSKFMLTLQAECRKQGGAGREDTAGEEESPFSSFFLVIKGVSFTFAVIVCASAFRKTLTKIA